MNKPQQLTFPWSKQNKFTFDDFFFDLPNEEVKLALKNNDDIFLYGAKDSGKSFLLQSTCNYYASDYKSSVYIPISEAIKHETSFIDSLEGLDLICLDDIDLIASNKDWEVGIFNLINDCLSSNCRLIFSSSENPSSIKFVSQLRSINLGDREINYLVTYTKRNMSDLIEIIGKLDQLSMELKRKITVPLIKEII
jgi:DnaA family protein